jgi:hypothetical protein
MQAVKLVLGRSKPPNNLQTDCNNQDANREHAKTEENHLPCRLLSFVAPPTQGQGQLGLLVVLSRHAHTLIWGICQPC